MNLTISGRNIEVTLAMRWHVRTKLDRISCKFNQPPTVTVVFGCEKHKKRDRVHCVTISFHTKGESVVVTEEREDMYSAVDAAVDNLERQLVAQKQQRTCRRHVPPRRLLGWLGINDV